MKKQQRKRVLLVPSIGSPGKGNPVCGNPQSRLKPPRVEFPFPPKGRMNVEAGKIARTGFWVTSHKGWYPKPETLNP